MGSVSVSPDGTESIGNQHLGTTPKYRRCEVTNQLDLSHCADLTSLPAQVGELKALASLDLYGCPAAVSMPAALKTQLEAQGTQIRQMWLGEQIRQKHGGP